MCPHREHLKVLDFLDLLLPKLYIAGSVVSVDESLPANKANTEKPTTYLTVPLNRPST